MRTPLGPKYVLYAFMDHLGARPLYLVKSLAHLRQLLRVWVLGAASGSMITNILGSDGRISGVWMSVSVGRRRGPGWTHPFLGIWTGP